MVGVFYKRRAEKGREEKQSTPTCSGKLTLGSAGHCPLMGFQTQNVNHVWLYAMGLEDNNNKLQHCGTLVCTGAL